MSATATHTASNRQRYESSECMHRYFVSIHSITVSISNSMIHLRCGGANEHKQCEVWLQLCTSVIQYSVRARIFNPVGNWISANNNQSSINQSIHQLTLNPYRKRTQNEKSRKVKHFYFSGLFQEAKTYTKKFIKVHSKCMHENLAAIRGRHIRGEVLL